MQRYFYIYLQAMIDGEWSEETLPPVSGKVGRRVERKGGIFEGCRREHEGGLRRK